MTGRRVLVSLVGDHKRDLDLARRRVAYDRLVLVAHGAAAPIANSVREAERRAAGDNACGVVNAPGATVAEHLVMLRALFDRHRRDRVVVNAAGGDHALAVAMLIAAFERGLETWFFQDGRTERLPVLAGVHLEERFGPDERRVLLALPAEGATSTSVAETGRIPRPQVERALRALAAKGAVRMEAREGRAFARVTSEGAYLREHLARAL